MFVGAWNEYMTSHICSSKLIYSIYMYMLSDWAGEEMYNVLVTNPVVPFSRSMIVLGLKNMFRFTQVLFTYCVPVLSVLWLSMSILFVF